MQIYNNDFNILQSRIRMSDLLFRLGFKDIDIKRHRAACLIHGGHNVNSFSYREETFYCFGCHRAGNKLQLIQLIKHCDFWTAVAYLENLTGFRVEKRIKIGDSFDVKSDKVDHVATIANIIGNFNQTN